MELVKTVPYLDKGFVELWDLSEVNKSFTDVKKCVATIATLSYGNNEAKNPELLFQKLLDNLHLSVFEFIRNPVMTSTGQVINYTIPYSYRHTKQFVYDKEAHKKSIFTFKIKIPLFVARQLVRHRCLSILELSRRYVRDTKIPFEFYNPDNNLELDKFYKEAVKLYNKLTSTGVKPEVARGVIPLSAYTIMWVQFDIDCLNNFLFYRLTDKAQPEIYLLAKIFKELIFNNKEESL